MSLKDILLALSVVFAWGFSFVVVKWGLYDMPPFLFATFRFALVAILVPFFPRPNVPFLQLLLYGISWGAIQFGTLFLSIYLGMPTGLASVVVQSQAFFTLIFAAFLLKEGWHISQMSGLILATIGLVLIAGNPSGMPIAGFLLNLLGAMGWAYGNIIVRKLGHKSKEVSSIGFLAWASIIPGFIMAGFSLMFEGSGRIVPALSVVRTNAVVAILYQAFVASLFGAVAWNRLLTKYPINNVAPFSLLVPGIGLFVATFVLNEKTSGIQFLGSAVLFSGLVINLFGKRIYVSSRFRNIFK